MLGQAGNVTTISGVGRTRTEVEGQVNKVVF
jgi:hypothetical protein